jgi:hypothetical protein
MGSKEVTLWDTAVLGDSRIPRQLEFDLGPRHRVARTYATRGSIVCDLGSNYKLPFCADPSMQLVGIRVEDGDARATWPPSGPSRILLIRSKVLSGFTSRIGTTSIIRWEDWLHFAKPIEIGKSWMTQVHLVHSHLVCLSQPEIPDVLQLYVSDLSPEYMRQEGDSGAIWEPNAQLIPVRREVLEPTSSYLTASNVIFKPTKLLNSVSPTSLEILLASSRLNATPPSILVRRTNVVMDVYSVGSSVRLHFTQTFKSIFFPITHPIAIRSLGSWMFWVGSMVHFVWFNTEISINNSTHTGSRDVRIYAVFSPAQGELKSYLSCRDVCFQAARD